MYRKVWRTCGARVVLLYRSYEQFQLFRRKFSFRLLRGCLSSLNAISPHYRMDCACHLYLSRDRCQQFPSIVRLHSKVCAFWKPKKQKNLRTVQVDRLSAYKLSTCQIDRLACWTVWPFDSDKALFALSKIWNNLGLWKTAHLPPPPPPLQAIILPKVRSKC